jgi:hypothetical protein
MEGIIVEYLSQYIKKYIAHHYYDDKYPYWLSIKVRLTNEKDLNTLREEFDKVFKKHNLSYEDNS